MKYNLIGVSGKIGSGKDTVGKIIQHLTSEWSDDEFKDSDMLSARSDFKIKKFADKLKQRIAFTWNIDKNKLEDQDFKNTLVPELGITWRKLMQLEGEKMREIYKDYWVKALFVDYDDFHNQKFSVRHGYQEHKDNWIITDVRYPNEADTIIDKGGIVIRVERETDNVSNHESETSLDDYDKFYTIIRNNGTIEELIKKIKNLDVV